jgi:hypothetical protein
MASWTCGGYPSPNLAAVKEYYFEPQEPATQALLAAAVQRFGSAAAASVIEAWKRFSEAFREFPYGVAIYVVPVQHGPANLLRLQPTGYRPAMMLFPYDDTKAWAGQYPPEVAWKQFARMALLWKGGLMPLAEAVRKAPQAKKALVQFEQAIGETCYNHFQSTANQFEFYLLRDKLRSGAGERKPALERMRAIAEEEIELARSQFRIARHQSTIGFEASNHYYYTPLDLVEKVVNCRHLLDEELPDA